MNNVKNNVRLIGRIGQTPEVKSLNNGKNICTFSIALNESYKNQDGEYVTSTQWHQVTAWGKQAERVAKLLQKGSEVAIEGKLNMNTYTDKQGVKRYATQVLLQEFALLGAKKAAA